ncbi:PspC domain-containing protein [Demequina sp. SYSU T00192]|uniref:PspC domain-containing protein n=1 Tax=Demequina litoralis TaxID=3051660 RepID=A0ABT8G782_9MICO|nr:PspC domain-containing protein [Demequina sp. SYSU T00192]MDN4474996.1 PspC domain-containing protein [Demequina sp. SYSU T00192]
MTDQQTPPTEASFFTTIRRWGLTRGDARVLGGVASGIAERLGWSLAWTRVGVAAVALLTHGLGLLAYAAAWALLPDRQGRIIAQDFGRGVPNVGALIVIGILTIVGLIGLGDSGGPWMWGAGGWPGDLDLGGPLRAVATVLAVLIPLAIVGGVIALIVVLSRRDRAPASGPGAPGPDGAPPVYAVPPAWAADRRAQREAARAAREEQRAYYAGQAYAAADEAVASANAAAESVTQATAQAVPTWSPEPAQPAPAAAPYAAPRPPRPPRVPGPGVAFWLLTLAWLVLSGAGTAWATWQDRLAVHPLIAWFALFVTGLGVILMLVALTGRRLGFLAFLSAVLLVPVTAMIVEADDIRDGWADRYFPEIRVDRDGDQVTRVEIGDGGIVIGEDGVTIGEDGIVIGSPAPAESDATVPSPDAEAAAEADFDTIAAFEADYREVTVPAACRTADHVPDGAGKSRSLRTLDALEQDSEVATAAEFTTVRIPAGTSLEIVAEPGASGEVHWADRDVACDIRDGAAFAVTNPGDPVLTLRVEGAAGYSTIVIEEVAS